MAPRGHLPPQIFTRQVQCIRTNASPLDGEMAGLCSLPLDAAAPVHIRSLLGSLNLKCGSCVYNTFTRISSHLLPHPHPSLFRVNRSSLSSLASLLLLPSAHPQPCTLLSKTTYCGLLSAVMSSQSTNCPSPIPPTWYFLLD